MYFCSYILQDVIDISVLVKESNKNTAVKSEQVVSIPSVRQPRQLLQ